MSYLNRRSDHRGLARQRSLPSGAVNPGALASLRGLSILRVIIIGHVLWLRRPRESRKEFSGLCVVGAIENSPAFQR